MDRNLTTLPLLVLSLLALALPAHAADTKGVRIKKCQDAQGKWHYGDTADEQCARSKVIELDTSGVKRKEIAPPLTEAELKAREATRAEDERLKKEAEEQKRRDDQLLATYALEDDINLTRDRKLSDLEAQIRFSQETLNSLRKSLERVQAQAAEEQRGGKAVTPQTAKTLSNNQAQIAKHEAVIEKMRKEQDAVRAQFKTDLERFREIKRKQTSAAPAADAKPAPKP
jgi:chromosome segregation ATPase